MPRYPETRALLEQAMRHVLSEEAKLLKRKDSADLIELIRFLNELVNHTSNTLTEGFNRVKSTDFLTQMARQAEQCADELSESIWKPIIIRLSAIYGHVDDSLNRKEGEEGLRADTRAHYHNLRLRLLEQMQGARMLVGPSDFGEQHERIWQEFLQRHLGPDFRVLQGGHIRDYEGNTSSQIDLIVVAAGAHIFVPGDAEGGKAHVLIDQVISAIMVTSNLTVDKLKSDWAKLQSLPNFPQFEKEFPHLKGHPWPFCYIVAAQSDPIDDLKKTWVAMCDAGLTRVVPQFVVSLDSGYMYGGLRRWPCPRYPGNYVNADDVTEETGIYSGLGLAWLLLQQQGRLALLHHQPTGPIARFARLIEDATMRSGLPPTFSARYDMMSSCGPIAGRFAWGRRSCYVHNRLQLSTLARFSGEWKFGQDVELYRGDADPTQLDEDSQRKLRRWFQLTFYRAFGPGGRLLVLHEWFDAHSKSDHRSQIVAFDTLTGEEIFDHNLDEDPFGPVFAAAKAVLLAKLEAAHPSPAPAASEAGAGCSS